MLLIRLRLENLSKPLSTVWMAFLPFGSPVRTGHVSGNKTHLPDCGWWHCSPVQMVFWPLARVGNLLDPFMAALNAVHLPPFAEIPSWSAFSVVRSTSAHANLFYFQPCCPIPHRGFRVLPQSCCPFTWVLKTLASIRVSFPHHPHLSHLHPPLISLS